MAYVKDEKKTSQTTEVFFQDYQKMRCILELSS